MVRQRLLIELQRNSILLIFHILLSKILFFISWKNYNCSYYVYLHTYQDLHLVYSVDEDVATFFIPLRYHQSFRDSNIPKDQSIDPESEVSFSWNLQKRVQSRPVGLTRSNRGNIGHTLWLLVLGEWIQGSRFERQYPIWFAV